MKRITHLSLAALTLASLTACGAQPSLMGAMRGQVALGTLGADKDKAAASDRVSPPKIALKALGTSKAGTPSRSWTLKDRICRVANDSLYRYDQLLRDWDAAWSHGEKDQVEQRMLETCTAAIREIDQVTRLGFDSEDGRANARASQVIERYRSLQRDWDRAYSDHERREIVNDMLRLLTLALKDFSLGNW